MNLNHPLRCLRAKWKQHLTEHRHHIYKAVNPRVIESRNSNKVRYRWLLLVSEVPERFLSNAEQMYIRYQLAQVKTRKETTYLVVGFVEEPGRIVVLPADAALKAGHVRSDKGGIAWED